MERMTALTKKLRAIADLMTQRVEKSAENQGPSQRAADLCNGLCWKTVLVFRKPMNYPRLV